jgi:hypothetical protein
MEVINSVLLFLYRLDCSDILKRDFYPGDGSRIYLKASVNIDQTEGRSIPEIINIMIITLLSNYI